MIKTLCYPGWHDSSQKWSITYKNDSQCFYWRREVISSWDLSKEGSAVTQTLCDERAVIVRTINSAEQKWFLHIVAESLYSQNEAFVVFKIGFLPSLFLVFIIPWKDYEKLTKKKTIFSPKECKISAIFPDSLLNCEQKPHSYNMGRFGLFSAGSPLKSLAFAAILLAFFEQTTKISATGDR